MATGSSAASSTPGTYTFSLVAPEANTLLQEIARSPPGISRFACYGAACSRGMMNIKAANGEYALDRASLGEANRVSDALRNAAVPSRGRTSLWQAVLVALLQVGAANQTTFADDPVAPYKELVSQGEYLRAASGLERHLNDPECLKAGVTPEIIEAKALLTLCDVYMRAVVEPDYRAVSDRYPVQPDDAHLIKLQSDLMRLVRAIEHSLQGELTKSLGLFTLMEDDIGNYDIFWQCLHKLHLGETHCRLACDPDEILPVYNAGRRLAEGTYDGFVLAFRAKSLATMRKNAGPPGLFSIERVAADLRALGYDCVASNSRYWNAYSKRHLALALLSTDGGSEPATLLQDAQKLYEQLGFRPGVAFCLQAKTVLLLEMQNFREAVGEAQGARSLFEDLSLPQGGVETYILEILAWQNLKEWDKAKALLARAQLCARQHNQQKTLANLGVVAAWLEDAWMADRQQNSRNVIFWSVGLCTILGIALGCGCVATHSDSKMVVKLKWIEIPLELRPAVLRITAPVVLGLVVVWLVNEWCGRPLGAWKTPAVSVTLPAVYWLTRTGRWGMEKRRQQRSNEQANGGAGEE